MTTGEKKMTVNDMTEEQTKAMGLLTTYLKVPVEMILRGAVAMNGQVSPEVMILGFCRALATVIGASYAGDDDGVRKFRERCRVEFSTVLHQTPVVPLPKLPPAQEKALDAA